MKHAEGCWSCGIAAVSTGRSCPLCSELTVAQGATGVQGRAPGEVRSCFLEEEGLCSVMEWESDRKQKLTLIARRWVKVGQMANTTVFKFI